MAVVPGTRDAERLDALGLYEVTDEALTVEPSTTAGSVLHVVESFGGGVAAAVAGIAESVPGFDHHLLYRPRSAVADLSLLSDGFSSTNTFDNRSVSARGRVKAVVADVGPDVLHAHSSWAGLLSRSIRLRLPIVYSPHCYAYLRTDIGSSTRWAFRMVERVLARRTAVLLANGRYEYHLATSLGYGTSAWTTMVSPDLLRLARPVLPPAAGQTPRIVTLGRWCPQKDPVFFQDVIDAYRRLDGAREASFTWIGGPDFGLDPPSSPPYRLTGWLPHVAVADELANAAVMIHTADWEAGIPIAVMEGLSRGIPTLVRTLPSAPELDVIGCDTPTEMAQRVHQILASHRAWRESQVLSRAIWSSLTSRIAHHRVEDVYRQLLEGQPE